MKLGEVNNGLQLIASAAVLLGLVLVVWELQQAKQLSAAQLIAESITTVSQREAAILGENPAASLARACSAPDSVTAEDARVLASYYQLVLDELSGMIEVELTGDWGAHRWQEVAPGTLLNLFSTEHGRWYWHWVNPLLFAELRTLGDRLLSEAGPPGCSAFFEAFRKREPLSDALRRSAPGS